MDRRELFEKRSKIKINDKISFCPKIVTMELIGRKWKSVKLPHLIDKKKHYNEFRKEILGILIK